MARINVYMPDQLAAAVRASGINLSEVTQLAAEREVVRCQVSSWLGRVMAERSGDVTHEEALRALQVARREQRAAGLPPLLPPGRGV
jgi:post-segregation antitoxin (ccd killing protein)